MLPLLLPRHSVDLTFRFESARRATWQGVSVAVKRLQLPPGARALGATAAASHSWGADCSYTVGSMSEGRARPGSGKQDNLGGLLKQEHMAVQVRRT
jgi:hypothetical protein